LYATKGAWSNNHNLAEKTMGHNDFQQKMKHCMFTAESRNPGVSTF
jgi:hypothetical protein